MSREVTLEECLRATGDPNELMRMCGETPLEEQEMGTVEKPAGRPAARR
jgi:hypothetical protein